MINSKKLITDLRDFFTDRGFTKAVVGLSGGVDSAVTMALGVQALGAENVTGILMPEEGVSSKESSILAKKVADQFGVQIFTQELKSSLETLSELPWGENVPAKENMRPRLRMLLLYHYALTHRALVLGTSNKSEILLGYGTKFGDFAADIEVIGSLWKTEVIELAKELEIPEEIIHRPPTAELSVGQTDADDLGGDYAKLDEVLKKLDENNFELPDDADEFTKKTLERVLANRHKTELPPIL